MAVKNTSSVGGSASGHASYPPPMRTTLPASTLAPTSSFLIHTETDSLHDLRLQVSIEPPPSASKQQPLRPLYFRERELTEHGEIVDYLIDASTAHVPWSIHKPARGWYLRLRSPALPRGTALPFRPPPKSEERRQPAETTPGSSHLQPVNAESSRSPLLISVPTRVHLPSLQRTRETIDQVLLLEPQPNTRPTTHEHLAEISLADGARLPPTSTQPHNRSSSASFLRLPHGRTLSGAHKKDDELPDDDDLSRTPTIIAEDCTPDVSAEGSATATSTSRSTPLIGHGHTRRRSGGSGSHRVEVRKVSNEPREALLRERVDEEGEDEEEEEEGRGKLKLQTSHLGLSTDRLSPNDASASSWGRDVLGSAGGGGGAHSYSADRPYSPTEPSAAEHPLEKDELGSEGNQSADVMARKRKDQNAGGKGQTSGDTSGSASQSGPTSTRPRQLIGGKTAPMLCHFVLLDGVDAASYETRLPYLPSSARRREAEGNPGVNPSTPTPNSTSAPATDPPTTPPAASTGIDSLRRRWANWAWSKLPTSIRPGALPLDTSHDFSLHWTNPPGIKIGTSIEVLRFRDLEGWSIFSSWNAQRRGRLVMQEEAVRALGLDRAFWVAVALAYLDFLEGRDSYNAACEG
ncbi:hypothetical protein CF327_g4910 [Tilletia walkeri]|nr:hypothetical protein CF327_g4910 [Tilletia walkeri]